MAEDYRRTFPDYILMEWFNSDHSTIEYAAHCMLVAAEAPVFDDETCEVLTDMLEDAQGSLRRVYLAGQDPSVPHDWRIDGLVWQKVDAALDKAKTRLTGKLRATKFFSGQRRREMAEAKKDQGQGKRMWYYLDSYDEYLRRKQSGFDVRIIYGYPNRYQYATTKETPKGRTK